MILALSQEGWLQIILLIYCCLVYLAFRAWAFPLNIVQKTGWLAGYLLVVYLGDNVVTESGWISAIVFSPLLVSGIALSVWAYFQIHGTKDHAKFLTTFLTWKELEEIIENILQPERSDQLAKQLCIYHPNHDKDEMMNYISKRMAFENYFIHFITLEGEGETIARAELQFRRRSNSLNLFIKEPKRYDLFLRLEMLIDKHYGLKSRKREDFVKGFGSGGDNPLDTIYYNWDEKGKGNSETVIEKNTYCSGSDDLDSTAPKNDFITISFERKINNKIE